VLRTDDAPLVARELPLTRPISSEDDGMGFALAQDVVVHAGRLVVLETGNSRLVVFENGYQRRSYIAREGSGPGELRGAVGLAAWQDEYAVVEVNNSRVSVFDTAGRFLRSFTVPNGFSNIEYGPDGTIYVDSHDRDNYLLAVSRDGTLRPFGARPLELYPDEVLAAPQSRIGGYIHLAVSPDGTVHTYDPILAAVVSFDRAARRVALHRIPTALADRLSRAAAQVARDFGGEGKGAPANITDMSATDTGLVLLLFPNVGSIGLLIDPADFSAREIRWGPDVDQRLGGYGGVLRGDSLYRLSADDLRLFRLSPQ
jgi:hypothetical protein